VRRRLSLDIGDWISR
jgi:histone acetyltransferase 1